MYIKATHEIMWHVCVFHPSSVLSSSLPPALIDNTCYNISIVLLDTGSVFNMLTFPYGENNGCSVCVCVDSQVCVQRAQPLHKSMPVTHAPHWAPFAKSPAICGGVCEGGVTICCGVRHGRRCLEMVVVGRGYEEGIRGYWGRKHGCVCVAVPRGNPLP